MGNKKLIMHTEDIQWRGVTHLVGFYYVLLSVFSDGRDNGVPENAITIVNVFRDVDIFPTLSDVEIAEIRQLVCKKLAGRS